MSATIEAALGRALPKMEVRFENVRFSADLAVADASTESSSRPELPTLANHAKKLVHPGSKHKATKQILKNVSGVFKAGHITLVLDQPGSGKSALMKVLSVRFPMKMNIHLSGEMTYNGTSPKELLNRLPQIVAYVTQRDKHFPTLTVQETLEFAHACCGGALSERAENYLRHG